MLELWQTEWCPGSRRVRERLTELGVDYVLRQVPVEKSERTALLQATGTETIPALVTGDAHTVVGEDAIRAYLDEHIDRTTPSRRTPRQSGNRTPPLSQGGMRMPGTGYTLSATTTLPFAEAVERVRDELKADGFGVLCEIDVQATMKEKLDIDGEPYLILGACNPPLAHQALEAEPELGVLLPCNVVVYERNGTTHVSAIDAERMLSLVGNDALTTIAADVRQRLAAVVERAVA